MYMVEHPSSEQPIWTTQEEITDYFIYLHHWRRFSNVQPIVQLPLPVK